MPDQCPTCQHPLNSDDEHCPKCGAARTNGGDEADFSWLDSCLTEPIDSSILDEHAMLNAGSSLPSSEPRRFESTFLNGYDSVFGSKLKHLPDIEPVQPRAIGVDDALASRTPGWLRSAGLGLAALLLLGVLVLQLLWFHRDRLIEYPLGRELLGALCRPIGCSPPQRRDLDHIRILLNDVKSLESPAKSLLITLTMGNTADFDQPYPRIDVTLLDTEEKVVGKRIFQPSDYLLPGTAPGQLFRAHSLTDASILLADPGPRATGYRFDFH